MRCEQEVSEVECEKYEDENSDAREELRMNDCKAHLIAGPKELIENEVSTRQETDQDTTLEGG